MKRRHKHLDNLFPFRIDTSKGHIVVMQCQDEQHAIERYTSEEQRHGKIISIQRVE